MSDDANLRTPNTPSEGMCDLLFQTLFHTAAIGIVLVGLDARIIEANERYARFLGYALDALRGMHLSQFTPADDLVTNTLFYEELIAGQHLSSTTDTRYVRNDGQIVWGHLTVSLIRNEDGQPQSLLIVCEDITNRVSIEAALHESEQRWQFALEGVEDGLWDWDYPTGEVFFSERWHTMLGYVPGEIPGHVSSWAKLVHPDDLPKVMDVLQAHLEGFTPTYVCEHRCRHKNGNWVWILDRGKVVMRNAAGQPLRVVGTHTDMSDRRAAEEALRASEEHFRMLVESAPVAIAVIHAGLVRKVNMACAQMFHYETPDAMHGIPVLELIAPADLPVMAGRMRRLAAGEAVESTYVTTGMRCDQQTFPVSVSAVRIADSDGFTSVVFCTDLTAQSRAESERLDLERQVLEAQKLESLGRMAGAIAHDFNNLLTSVLGQAALIAADLPPDSPYVAAIQEIHAAGQRAATLTAQMLTYSGRGAMSTQRLDLEGVIHDMETLIRSVIPATMTFTLDIPPNLPAINGDSVQIRQAITNLLINAAEAIGNAPGQITLSLRLIEADAALLSTTYPAPHLSPGPYLALTITDTGVGMDMAIRTNMFEPFFSTKFTGRGLGLPAVLGVVRGHGGTIQITSAPGSGTSISLLFPALAALPVTIGPTFSCVSSEVANPAPATVLVIDDEEGVRAVTTRMLERAGYRVLAAADGPTGLYHYATQQEKIACVLLDLTMPVMSGQQVFQALRERDPAIPVVLMSGYAAEEATSRVGAAGLAGFLAKPFRPADLRDAIARAVRSVSA